MNVVLIIISAVAVISLSLMIYEIKHAPIVDSKEPFLWDEFK